MTTKAKLLAAALALVAIGVTPAAAATASHHARTHRAHVVRVTPPVPSWQNTYGYVPYGSWQGAYGYAPRAPLTGAEAHMDGFQHDRQMVGVY